MASHVRLASLAFASALLAALPAVAQTTTSTTAQENPHVSPKTEALPAPASQGVQTGVRAILPNGRQIRPAGSWIPVAPYPFAIALKGDGTEAAIPSIGFPFALNIISRPDAAGATVRRFPSAEENDPAVEVHAGLAYSPEGRSLYVATGNSGKVAIYSTTDWRSLGQIPLDGKIFKVAPRPAAAPDKTSAQDKPVAQDKPTAAPPPITKAALPPPSSPPKTAAISSSSTRATSASSSSNSCTASASPPSPPGRIPST